MEQVLLGLVVAIAGAILFYGGLKEDKSAMGALKYRKLMIGGLAVLIGLVLMFR